MDENRADTPGGTGDVAPARLRRSDFHLLRRAARERWGVPDTLKSDALYEAYRIIADDDPDADPRAKVAAMKFVAECDRIDQADEKIALDRAKFDHATRPPETATDSAPVIDLGPDDPPANPPHPAA